ncbi:Ankyrin repeat domain-containing protein [Trema orientale]|uniref:Ankyrin repeat domain-containing protein n=1 Tax=Trema orientale TaxID=63057 RepID=A0A2P5BJF1_TREOI|nr:Ankyrin repeat domain-containing protein [Trema orientale]
MSRCLLEMPTTTFDGLKIQCADQSFVFLNDDNPSYDVAPESLLVHNRNDRKIFDAFESIGSPMTDFDIGEFYSQTSIYRLGIDVTTTTTRMMTTTTTSW